MCPAASHRQGVMALTSCQGFCGPGSRWHLLYPNPLHPAPRLGACRPADSIHRWDSVREPRGAYLGPIHRCAPCKAPSHPQGDSLPGWGCLGPGNPLPHRERGKPQGPALRALPCGAPQPMPACPGGPGSLSRAPEGLVRGCTSSACGPAPAFRTGLALSRVWP